MIAYGLFVTVAAWCLLWCVGEAAARLLFGRRAALVTSATRPPLGLSATLCLLELAGYFLPIRSAVWLLGPPAIFGAVTLVRAPRRRLLVRDCALAVASFVALFVGLLPVAAAGRFTAAALTNND